MATFTFSGQLFDITENPNGSARTLSAQAATLRVTTSADTGFFTYRTIGFDAELPDVEIFNSNITSATVNGFEVFSADDVDSSIGTITINGAESFTLALNRETDLNRFDLALFSLDGADLPTVSSAGQFNQILGSADFGIGSGPLAANQRIEFNDLEQAGFTAGVPVQNGSASADVIVGDADADNIEAGGGSDRVEGGGGNDTISGGGGKDTLNGGAGSDELNGGGGSDVINGGGGKDVINGNGGKDVINGNGGADVIDGGGGKDVINGGGGKDTIDGQGGRDSVDGGGGKDIVMGGGGNDTLTGGRGVDELTGGRGRDQFEFKQGDGRDTVTDYEDGRDKFVIGVGAEDFADLTIAQFGDDARITFANVRITVEDTDADLLGASDFLFG